MGELTSHKDGHLVCWKPTRGQEVFITRDNCYESKLYLGTKSLINCQKYGAKFLLKETFTQALIDHHMFKIIPLIYLYKRHVHCSQLGKNTCVTGMVHEQYAEGYEIVHGITHYMVFHTNSAAQPACPRVRVQMPFLCFSFFLHFVLPFLLEVCMFCALFCFRLTHH